MVSLRHRSQITKDRSPRCGKSGIPHMPRLGSSAERISEFREYREEEHCHRGGKSKCLLPDETCEVERDGKDTRGSDVIDVHVSGDFMLRRIHVIVFTRLDAAFSGKAGVFL